MARCSATTTTTGCSASWCGRSISPTTNGCRSTRPKRCCASASAELPSVETLYGWSAEEVTQDAARRARSCIAERNGDGRRTCADYLVGCDGSRSIVREQAGITQTLSDHDRLMVLLVFRSHELHTLLERFPGKSFYSVLHPDLKGYWKFFGRVDLGTTWFFHAPVPPGTTRDNFDFRALSACGRRRGVRRRVRAHRLLGSALRHRRSLSQRAHLHRRRRRAQPSALWRLRHQYRPRGRGQSRLEAGRGAAGLGRRELLDSYDEERRPVFASTARDFIEKAIPSDRVFLAAYDPDSDRAAFDGNGRRASPAPARGQRVRAELPGLSIVWGPPGSRCSAIGSHQFAARAGHHLTPLSLPADKMCSRNWARGLR